VSENVFGHSLVFSKNKGLLSVSITISRQDGSSVVCRKRNQSSKGNTREFEGT